MISICHTFNAIGNELNQVWTNLIDNAIDGIGNHGTISIRTKNEGNSQILVEVVDNGLKAFQKTFNHVFLSHSLQPRNQVKALVLD